MNNISGLPLIDPPLKQYLITPQNRNYQDALPVLPSKGKVRPKSAPVFAEHPRQNPNNLHCFIHLPLSPKNAQAGQEGMEAQLALLQKQMALLMASLQPKSPPAAALSPPEERTSQPQSPSKPAIPEPTPEDTPPVAKPTVSQKLPKKSKKSQPLRNLHQYRAALKSQSSTAEERDWI
ncbi:hypothetical protein DSO57_1018009 [Entomophthora muscae]|uniref:Uncharacterized protein n=1 Tax=Entomophthora muscae TaxID=34485 RepID=A0ACC2TF64_9FUNG|nr:hypothetical protein DSO57_1018009 [Entomophthora muscae]